MELFEKLKEQFSKTSSDYIGQAVEQLVNSAIVMRRSHERRWFDNNFFDDGYHFRVVSKRTGRVIDQVNVSNAYVERAIPRASRQIRAVSNLLFAAEPYPVVYPERITIEKYRGPDGQIDVQAYKQSLDKAKHVARLQGNWITNEWEEQELPIKLIDMLLLAAKNSISYLQVYSDTDHEKIKSEVFDAFDIITFGDRRCLHDEPFMTKTKSMDLVDVMTDPRFDPAMVKRLTPDNKYATSEIKDAYMRARYGSKVPEGKDKGTIIIKETFMKEVLSDENWKQAIKLGSDTGAMEGKSKGDIVMRHPFSAGGITLKDEYVDYDCYPFAEFRYEPGMLYQIPFIERFIPQNKSIDVVVTRLEKWVNAMIVGVYQKRKGENFQLSNFPGGQVVEYETTPLTQMNTASVGNTPFNVVEMLDKYLDEQGATTAGGINVPTGVKSGVAIESVKATEYANLKIPTMMLKRTIKTITELLLERADKDYVTSHEVSYIEDGEPKYFDVIGQRGMQLSAEVKKELPENVVPLKKDLKVRIEIEPGLGLTMEGKKAAMQQIIDYMIKLMEIQPFPADAVKQVIKRFMEVFGYGSTQEFMEVLDTAPMPQDMDEQNIMKMKIAIIEALKDAGAVGPEMEKRLVDSTKLGVLETLKESGMLDKKDGVQAKEPSKSISFKDLPPEGQTQLAAQAGIQITPQAAKEEKDNAKQSSYPINKFKKSSQGGSL